MKRLISIFAGLVVMVGMCLAQSLNDHPAYEVIVSNYGTRNGDTVTNAIAQVGNRACLFVFDRGPWQIQTNVTFPTNIGVVVGPDSYFVISNNCTMTFQTNDLVAWHYPVFTGSGLATGTAKMVFRMSQWGSSTQYNIGLGDVETYVTNTYVALGDLAALMTNRYPNLQTNAAANTLAGVLSNGVNAASQNATNFALVQAVTGDFDVVEAGTMNILTQNVTGTFLNSSNDMALSFMGYPKITLTTNMVTRVLSAGTGISISSFTNAFDLSNATVTDSPLITASQGHSYLIDLGFNYNGFCSYKASATNTTDSITMSIVSSTADVIPFLGASGQYYPTPVGSTYIYNSTSTNRPYFHIAPFSGRYLYFSVAAGGDDSANYKLHDFSVYATTNAYRNMGGF